MATDKDSLSQLSHLFGAYLNQDYDLAGDTMDEILDCYVDEHDLDELTALLDEVRRFTRTNTVQLDVATESTFAPQVDLVAFCGAVPRVFETLSKRLEQAILGA